ncbi:MAG TPA: hypothetical protein PLV72_00915 [Candidatus Magasanikbacteria bacterium]|nr:hypothetical protein [Candidatus Magasanikbacteria bacterium]
MKEKYPWIIEEIKKIEEATPHTEPEKKQPETMPSLIKMLGSDESLLAINIDNGLIYTDREKNAKNRLFSGGLGLGKDNPISLKTSNENAYRVTGEPQIQDIIESGFVRPPLGKLKGGHCGEVHWSEGNDKLFYYDKRPVLEIDKSKVLDGTMGAVKITDLKAIWIFNEERKMYENKIMDFLKNFSPKK